MLIAFSILAAIFIISLSALLMLSPGKPRPFLDENGKPIPGSLSEKIFIEINGMKQGMFIKSKDVNHPVLLFIHGGPGMPEYWLTQTYPTHLEEHFTVVWWEQRGAGLSFTPDTPPETMTTDNFVSDALAVTNYLRERFGQEKIYLMGHSWGSYIGIQTAAAAPELFHAYIGVGQLTHQLESEHLAYALALEIYQKDANETMIRKLQAAPPTLTAPLPDSYLALRDQYMHETGIGTTHQMKSVITGIFVPSWFFREYTLEEKINLWRGKIFSRSDSSALWDEMLSMNLTKAVNALEIPVYFLHGIYDYTCAYPLAKAYFEALQAPIKGFYTFHQSAHSPMFEEPAFVIEILVNDVLSGTTRLADSE